MSWERKDLVVLTADDDIRHALDGILTQKDRLGIRTISYDVFTHPNHDPGCLRESATFLRAHIKQYERALVVFDREGCGRDGKSRKALEQDVETSLASNGWADRAAGIAIDPELEIWVFSNAPHVEDLLGFRGAPQDLRCWLVGENWLVEGRVKPQRPKEALQAALRFRRKPRSASIYRRLGALVPLERCTDAAFVKLRDVLRRWFAHDATSGHEG
ncbi:hypothetical protein [Polyangium sp. y55x31]|uniref:methylation-associated defense system protein MAD4 n=1 Tax=Polyangium sp. y55x31 TaxID=3042688 RepID=UPI00248318A9|nr:hypothetical protein [Polyangium sp. y55x31]MDI1476002.1 hypothetical protein [Polyangium sp. y55x31]